MGPRVDASDASYMGPLEATSLSVETKRSYATKIKVLQEICGVHHTIDWLLRHPKQVYACLVAKTKESSSRASSISAIMAVYKHVDGLKDRYPKENAAWSEHMSHESAETAKRYQTNVPPPRQVAAHVPWEDVMKARDALPLDGTDYLFFAMYTMQPPVRSDYDRLAILYKEPTAKRISEEPNYLVIKGPTDMTMHLNAYKTKREGHDGMTQALPPHLCDVIWKSLEREPRTYMFTEIRSGSPFKDPAAYTKFAGRILKRVLGNPHASLNTLRHSYLSSLDPGIDVGIKADIARRMMHGPWMGMAYRFHLQGEGQYDVSKMGLPPTGPKASRARTP